MQKLLERLISWEIFKQFAVVLGVLVGLVTLTTYFTKSKSELSITVSYSSFTWPTIPDISLPKKDDHIEIYEEIITSLKILKDFSRIESAWYLGIHNSGNKEAKNLRLKIPYTFSYQLDRDGFELVMKEYHEFISIKDIQPDESIYVVGWVTKDLVDEDMNGVKLAYSDGRANKIAYVKIEDHWKMISQKWRYVALVILILVIIYLMIQINSNRNA